jgi:DNA adenine methylase
MQEQVIHQQNKSYLYDDKLPICYPFVKWAGGKTQLLEKLYSFIPSKFDLYFEPFLGGGALFFYLTSNKNRRFTAYLSDINSELINSYIVVKDNVEKLIELLRLHELEYKNAPLQYYYQLRKTVKAANSIERAARFIVLNRTCYNGLYRVNNQGTFNVPWGKYKDPLICNSSNLRNVSLALKHSKAIVKVSNYKKIVLGNAKEGDFIYLDPPYNPVSSTSYFTKYTHSGFNNKDQEELATIFIKLDDKKCRVLLSNSDTYFIRELYSDFAKYIVEVDVIRSINSKGSKRAGHKELIIRNYSR